MPDSRIIEAVREAARSHVLPGGITWRVLLPDSVEAIAAALAVERRDVELAALDSEIVPVHYLRNIARFAIRGQITLLSSGVAVVGAGPAAAKCLETLAIAGVGHLRALTLASAGAAPAGAAAGAVPVLGSNEEGHAAELAAHARNRNAAVDIRSGMVALRRGNPAEALRGVSVVACCLEQAVDETLLQAACRQAGVPLVCAGVQESRAQATTILPGDPGVGLVYRPDHPHLEKERPGASFSDTKAPQVVGVWMAEQCLNLILGDGEVLRGQLLYADLYEGEMATYPLG
jgi:molybdopterin/thiamine biosynthesis adenylyltransferase